MIYMTSTDSPGQYTILSYSVDKARSRGYDTISEFEPGDSIYSSYYLMNGLGKVGGDDLGSGRTWRTSMQ